MDSQYPPVGERQDYRNFIDYLIKNNRLDSVICGNNDQLEYENINKTHIFRPSSKTTIENRKSELKLVFFQIGVLHKYLKKGDQLFIYYYSTAFLILLFAKIIGANTTTHFISVPVKRIYFGKLLRTCCALLSDQRVFYNFTQQREEMFLFKMKNKSIFMPIGVNLQEFNSLFINKNTERKLLKIPEDDFVFISIGTIHKTRKVEDVIDAFCELCKQHANTSLIIAGGGPYYETIKKYTQSKNNAKIFLTGIINHSEVIRLCKISDVGITYYSIKIFNVQPALKTLEYIASGLPVIAVNTIGNRFYLEGKDIAQLIKDNKDSLKSAMEQYLITSDLVEKHKENIKRYDINCYDYNHIHESFIKQINF